eukprot:COSAG05_NODE_4911_length_1330_cov_3.320877_1_plen_259_part_10
MRNFLASSLLHRCTARYRGSGLALLRPSLEGPLRSMEPGTAPPPAVPMDVEASAWVQSKFQLRICGVTCSAASTKKLVTLMALMLVGAVVEIVMQAQANAGAGDSAGQSGRSDSMVGASQSSSCSDVPSNGVLVVPDDITSLGDYSGCKKLKKILFRKTSKLRGVQKNAFGGTSLSAVALPPLCKSNGYLPFEYGLKDGMMCGENMGSDYPTCTDSWCRAQKQESFKGGVCDLSPASPSGSGSSPSPPPSSQGGGSGQP